jgi:hypothetical protein
MMAMSQMSIPVPVGPPASARLSDTVTVNGIQMDPDSSSDGMEKSQRNKIIDAITLVKPVTLTHRRHLDLLLKYSGQKIFPFVNESTSVAEIRHQITSVPSASVSGLDYVNTPAGVIRVNDTQATFQPSDAGDTVQAIAVNTGSPTSFPTAMTRNVPFKFSIIGSIISLIESLFSLLLGVVLLVGGILLLRNSIRYAQLHWIYVLAKIPLAFTAAIASWVTYKSMMSTIASNMPQGASPGMSSTMSLFMILPTLIWLIIVLSYPIVLIFILNSRTAKIYKNDLRGIRE